jgi:hypothetical protein
MALSPPTQERTLDEYSAERWSSVVTRMTRTISGATDCVIFTSYSFPMNLVDYKTVRIGTGTCIKDDIMIYINAVYDIDFTNGDFFVDDSNPMDEAGRYYIVLEYTYSRSFPAPRAYFKVIKDTATYYTPFTDRYIFIGIADVVYNGGAGRYEIDAIADEDIGGGVARPTPPLLDEVVTEIDGGEI